MSETARAEQAMDREWKVNVALLASGVPMMQMLFQHPEDVVIGTGLVLALWWMVGYEDGPWQETRHWWRTRPQEKGDRPRHP